MIEKQKRDALLTGHFEVNEEVLVNARDVVKELQAKDHYEREIERLGLIIAKLQYKVESYKVEKILCELDKPIYKRYEVRG
jgi:hypothetical protein